MEKKVITTPIKTEDIKDLRVGDMIYLTGMMATCRDSGHARRVREGIIPEKYEFAGNAIFHAGPIVKKDEKTGRMMMVPVEGSEKVIPADLVLIAAGFLGSQKYVTDAFHVAVNGRTNVDTKPDDYATSVPRVFTAGDMHRGQSLVVWAIREGREAAKAVDESLMGYTNL